MAQSPFTHGQGEEDWAEDQHKLASRLRRKKKREERWANLTNYLNSYNHPVLPTIKALRSAGLSDLQYKLPCELLDGFEGLPPHHEASLEPPKKVPFVVDGLGDVGQRKPGGVATPTYLKPHLVPVMPVIDGKLINGLLLEDIDYDGDIPDQVWKRLKNVAPSLSVPFSMQDNLDTSYIIVMTADRGNSHGRVPKHGSGGLVQGSRITNGTGTH